MKIKNAFVAGAMVLAMSNAQAALIDRGDGLIYDDVLNVSRMRTTPKQAGMTLME